jgi:hypothetical protein
MNRTDFDSSAFRRRLVVGLGSFLLGFVGLLVVAAYLLAVYVQPQRGWFEAVVFLLQLLPLIFAGAGLIAIGAMYAIDLPSVLRGRFRCDRCGRFQGRRNGFCVCELSQLPARRKRHWIHYRRRIRPVLLTHCAVLGLVLIIVDRQSGPHYYPLFLHVMIGHAVLVGLLGVLIHLASSILEVADRGRRFRLRAAVFVPVLAIWPFSFCMVMAILTGMGWV